LETIDAHTAGEPFRVIVSGFPELKGHTILERRRDAMDRYDNLRRTLMWEPRGHADMYGCIMTEPESDDSDLGILFMHNEGFSTMCGHGIIGIATVALTTDILPINGNPTELFIDTPAGKVQASAYVADGRVSSVRFRNVPSYVHSHAAAVTVPGVGEIRVTIAFGGAYYAIVDAGLLGLSLKPDATGDLVRLGREIKAAVVDQIDVAHPFEDDLGFLYGTIFVGPPYDPKHHSRNVCVFAEGEVDRCPTGTGVSARLAIEHSLGNLKEGEWIEVESILGTLFRGRVVRSVGFGGHQAVVPEIEGSAHITGHHTFLVDPEDPLKEGFILR
jgi:trans-L-3-hydroxyproline dehydratase